MEGGTCLRDIHTGEEAFAHHLFDSRVRLFAMRLVDSNSDY